MKEFTIDQKIDRLEASINSINKNIDEKIADFAGMVAREFTRMYEKMDTMEKRVEKRSTNIERIFDAHLKRSEKDRAKIDKRFVLLERLLNI